LTDTPPTLREDDTVEVRTLWALRWPDGTVSGAMYSPSGDDYAEQTIRSFARGDRDVTVVRQTETITRTPWEPA